MNRPYTKKDFFTACGFLALVVIITALSMLLVAGCSTAQYSDVSGLNKNPQAGVAISTNPVPKSVSGLNRNPPIPISAMSAKLQEAVESAQFARAIAPERSNALVSVRWDYPQGQAVRQFNIYTLNEMLVATVDAAYNNFTQRGLRDGDDVMFYATAIDFSGEESDPSNIATGKASVKPPWIVPSSLPYARTFTWRCAPGVTNILQSSANLTTWTTASRFRGTNGTAVVTLTNQLPFHRVLVQNATNVARMTLTQNVSFITLTWPGDGTPKLLERLANPKTESYLTILTNSGIGNVSVIQPFSGATYRVIRR